MYAVFFYDNTLVRINIFNSFDTPYMYLRKIMYAYRYRENVALLFIRKYMNLANLTVFQAKR